MCLAVSHQSSHTIFMLLAIKHIGKERKTIDRSLTSITIFLFARRGEGQSFFHFTLENQLSLFLFGFGMVLFL